jgi:hypothetical protein
MVQHLIYKALFELSTDRAEFLSRLFSRPRPADVGSNSTAEDLFNAFDRVHSDPEMFRSTLAAIRTTLVEKHGFTLTAADETSIHHIFSAFLVEGSQLTYDGRKKRLRGVQISPTYADLMMQTDGNHQNRSYIGSEENFRWIQDLERRNLVIPLVGNFAGEKAIRHVAQYLKDYNATVAVFYLPNVEQYLFEQGDDWVRFYSNVESLPVDSSSTFIRSFFHSKGGGPRVPGDISAQSDSLLCPIEIFLDAFRSGEIHRYHDIIDMSIMLGVR